MEEEVTNIVSAFVVYRTDLANLPNVGGRVRLFRNSVVIADDEKSAIQLLTTEKVREKLGVNIWQRYPGDKFQYGILGFSDWTQEGTLRLVEAQIEGKGDDLYIVTILYLDEPLLCRPFDRKNWVIAANGELDAQVKLMKLHTGLAHERTSSAHPLVHVVVKATNSEGKALLLGAIPAWRVIS